MPSCQLAPDDNMSRPQPVVKISKIFSEVAGDLQKNVPNLYSGWTSLNLGQKLVQIAHSILDLRNRNRSSPLL